MYSVETISCHSYRYSVGNVPAVNFTHRRDFGHSQNLGCVCEKWHLTTLLCKMKPYSSVPLSLMFLVSSMPIFICRLLPVVIGTIPFVFGSLCRLPIIYISRLALTNWTERFSLLSFGPFVPGRRQRLSMCMNDNWTQCKEYKQTRILTGLRSISNIIYCLWRIVL